MSPAVVRRPRARLLLRAGLGLLFGFSLSIMGFSRADEVHAMFTFADLRLFLSFAVGVALIALAIAVARPQGLDARVFHRGTLIGAVIFGVGWALIGACPGAVLVQLGEAQWPALISAAGVVVGTYAYLPVHRRFLRWDRDSC